MFWCYLGLYLTFGGAGCLLVFFQRCYHVTCRYESQESVYAISILGFIQVFTISLFIHKVFTHKYSRLRNDLNQCMSQHGHAGQPLSSRSTSACIACIHQALHYDTGISKQNTTFQSRFIGYMNQLILCCYIIKNQYVHLKKLSPMHFFNILMFITDLILLIGQVRKNGNPLTYDVSRQSKLL